MAFVAFSIEYLQKDKGYSCLYCLVIASTLVNGITEKEQLTQSLHIYESNEQRERALNTWRHRYNLTETVFFKFQVPIEFYLEKAEKVI